MNLPLDRLQADEEPTRGRKGPNSACSDNKLYGQNTVLFPKPGRGAGKGRFTVASPHIFRMRETRPSAEPFM
jgi:hypothetical protein